ncbi:MAG: glycosyltransferase family 4 protein [Flavobacteriales bacterium]|nr:glycosyltransferase family 4 protein [Flavobacteriales bacterium]
MKILILTQYFPPEVGAPQNRLYELAIRLKEKGDEVTILTAMPNYPKMEIHEGYKGKWRVKEEIKGLTVHRSWIYVSNKKSIVRRLLNYYSFVFSAFWVGLFRIRKQDILLVESPPLFLGKTAWLLSLFKRSKMIFNVSDLWPESAEKLGLVNNKLLLWGSYKLEAFLYRRSWLVSGQTQGIVKDIQKRFPKKDVVWLPNGVNVRLFVPQENEAKSWRTEIGLKADDFVLLYAGIIGYAQGLDILLKAAERLKTHQQVKFVLLGSGPEKERLLALKQEMHLDNVLFLDPVPKAKMPAVVSAADAAVIPLRKLDLFLGAIPSKLFENLAMKKPILLGVDGEARELFIEKGKGGLYFEPDNDEDLAAKVELLISNPHLVKELGENGHRYVSEYFDLDKIAEGFRTKLIEKMK